MLLPIRILLPLCSSPAWSCSKMNFQLVYSPPVHVNTVSVVMYENCCLEKQLVSTHIQLQQPEDTSPVSEEQKAHVRKVADEFSAKNVPNYWFHVSKDGELPSHSFSLSCYTLVTFSGAALTVRSSPLHAACGCWPHASTGAPR